MSSKPKKIIGWVLTALLAVAFISTAIMKFTSSGEAAEKMAAGMGLTAETVKIIGVVELISILLFVIPRTGILGTLLLAAYMGGAIATHLEHHLSPVVPIILQCVVWITAVIRFPELTRRFRGADPTDPLLQ